MEENKVEFIKLPKDFKAKWLKELREGNHPQAICSMYRPKVGVVNDEERCAGYCCLGIAGLACGMTNEDLINHGAFAEFSKEQLNKFNVPHTLRAPVINHTSPIPVLIRMNDIEKKSFKEIASWIELNL